MGYQPHSTHTPPSPHYQLSTMAAIASVASFTGLKAATVFDKKAANPLAVSNGYTTSAMMVWTPNNNKFFETMSYLPPLSPQEIAKQIDYIVACLDPLPGVRLPRDRLHHVPRLWLLPDCVLRHRGLLRQPLLGHVEAAHVRLP